MQGLGLYVVKCTYSEISNTEQGLSNIDIIPDWNYDRGRSVANFIYSYNADVYQTSDIPNILENKTGITSTNFRKISNIDLYCDCPATIEYSQDSLKKITKVISEEIDRDISYQYTSYVTYTFNTGNYELSSYYRMYDSNTNTEIITNYIANDDGSVTSYSNTTESDGSTTLTYTTTNENGITTGSYSYTQHPNGSTASSELTYDENGNLTNEHNTTQNPDGSHSDQTVVHNSDGSSVGQTTNYDNNNNPVSGENQWTDPIGNENTQSVEYDSGGNPEVVGYEIDTSGNESGTGEDIVDGLDTGFIAFNGKSFTIEADIEFAMNDQGTTYFKTLISAIEIVSGTNYKGFYIRNGGTLTLNNEYINKIGLYARETGLQIDSNGKGNGYQFGNNINLLKARRRYTINIEYTPGTKEGTINFEIYPTANAAGTTISDTTGSAGGTNSSLPPTMDNAQIILGGNMVSDNFNFVNLTVYSFRVVKTG